MKKLHNGNIAKDAIIMLNVTGGGFERLAPNMSLPGRSRSRHRQKDFTRDSIQEKVIKLMR
jgi:hypothetical protein